MNRIMALKTKSGLSSQRLANDIRQHFLGDSSGQQQRNADLRIALYSHDTMGVGHMRRNLLIASHIKRSFPQSSTLALAGAKEATMFSQNAGIDCLTLPAFCKKPDGTYTTRNLGISASDVLNVRSRTIFAAIKSYAPDLFIVDKVPAGAGGELLPTLEWLSSNTECRCVLGLRDVLDTPEHVAKDWQASHTTAVIRRHFSSIWVYGDPRVYNVVGEYRFAEDIAKKVVFTGYLNTESRLRNLIQLPYEINVPYVLCTVGGGQDGQQLSLNFIDAIRKSPRNAVLLTGPYLPESTKSLIHAEVKTVPTLKVVEFVDEGDLLIKHASHVVSMGGYNTVAAILSHKKTALIVPRVTPREEQWLRASRLAELGFVETLHPREASSDSIANWLDSSHQSAPGGNRPLDMNGLDCIRELIRIGFPHTSTHFKQEPGHAASNGRHA